jgi:hypothetical protein
MSKNSKNVHTGSVSPSVKYDESYRQRGSSEPYKYDLWKLCFELSEAMTPGLRGESFRHSSHEIYQFLIINQKELELKHIPNPGRIRERIRFFKKNVVRENGNKAMIAILALSAFTYFGSAIFHQVQAFNSYIDTNKSLTAECNPAFKSPVPCESIQLREEVLEVTPVIYSLEQIEAMAALYPEASESAEPELSQEEQMKQIIRDVWGEYAELGIAIARCESGFNPEAVNPTSSARGLFQVMQSWHKIDQKWLFNPVINTHVAYQLYQEQGVAPWEASKHCWGE